MAALVLCGLWALQALAGERAAYAQSQEIPPQDAWRQQPSATTAAPADTAGEGHSPKERIRLKEAVKLLVERVQPSGEMLDADELGDTRKGDAPEKYVGLFGIPDREVELGQESLLGLEKSYPGGKAFVYRHPGVIVAFNSRMRSERVLVGCLMQGLDPALSSSAPGASALIEWRASAPSGALLTMRGCGDGPALEHLEREEVRQIEISSGCEFTFLTLEVDNSKGQRVFEFTRSMFGAVTREGKKVPSSWQQLRVPAGMDKHCSAYFLGTKVPPKEKRSFLIPFAKSLKPQDIERIEISLLYGQKLVCE